MVAELRPWADLVTLNARLFRNTLAEMNEADGASRPNDRTNSVAFIAGHLVETRAWMSRYLGGVEPAPFGGALEHATGIDQVASLPTLAAIGSAWDAVSDRLDRRLEELSDSDLGAASTQRFPGVAATVLGGISFLVQHESYHIGQLAFLRKYLGLGPMSYR